jgi:hypothetical protein
MLKKLFVILFVIINLISLSYSLNQIQTPSNNSIITSLNSTIITSIFGTENTSTFINWDNSLVGYWNFESNTNDLSSNSNHGTFTNGGSIQSTNKIRGNNSYFDGTNDYINIGSGSNLDILENMSISVWFNAYSFPSSGTLKTLVGRGIGGESSNTNFMYSFGLVTISDTTYLRAGHEYGSGSNTPITSNYSVQRNTWYNVILLRDTINKEFKFYVNGEFKSNLSYTNNPDGGSSGITSIGRAGGYSAEYFHGKLDEVMIFNRILSENEIKSIYNSQLNTLEFQPNMLQDNTTYTYDIFTTNTSGYLLEGTYNFYTNTSYIVPSQNINTNIKKLPSLSLSSLILSIFLLLIFLI